MSQSIIKISHQFFEEVVQPLLLKHFSQEASQMAFGFFGYGSEVLQLDDAYSQDHHWGIRIDVLMPEDTYVSTHQAFLEVIEKNSPSSFQGIDLRVGLGQGVGVSPDSLERYLKRTIGLERAPQTFGEWLKIPEEDILHVINGQVWQDEAGRFTDIRNVLKGYYPETVHLRRIAHWCRYFSGMGTYALKRAILRNNELYAATAFGKAIRWGIQLAFLLDKQYFPYDKWLYVFFKKLPRLSKPLAPLVEEAISLKTSWQRKLELLDKFSDILDQTMINDGIIQPHPPYQKSSTSGYRLTEHAYAEIIQSLPHEVKTVVPVFDQIYLETFHCGYVNTLTLKDWDNLLNLQPK